MFVKGTIIDSITIKVKAGSYSGINAFSENPKGTVNSLTLTTVIPVDASEDGKYTVSGGITPNMSGLWKIIVINSADANLATSESIIGTSYFNVVDITSTFSMTVG